MTEKITTSSLLDTCVRVTERDVLIENSKLVIKIQKRTSNFNQDIPGKQNFLFDKSLDTSMESNGSEYTEEDDDDESLSINSSETDDYADDGESQSSSHFESDTNTNQVITNTSNLVNFDKQNSNGVGMSKSEVDLLAQKEVNKIMDQGLQKQIEKLVSGEIWTCEFCGKIFDDKVKYRFHLDNHKKRKNHKCETCGRGFIDKKRLLCHMSSHTGDKLYSCETCGKKLSQMSGMKRHMRVHTGEKPFTCGVCQKNFTTKGSLKVHMRLHTGEKPFKCGICGNTFTARSTLWSHLKIHTGEKDLECKICGKHFTLNSTLKKHLLIHDENYNERFPCDICGKEYMARNSMQRHRKTHSMEEEKPYSCEICGNKFAMQSSLRRHHEIHFRGDMTKDFPCEYCPKYFAYKSSVVLHMKRKHKLKADGTPLDSDAAGMFIVPNDAIEHAKRKAGESDLKDEESDDKDAETLESTDKIFDKCMFNVGHETEKPNNQNEQFLYALDLVKREISKQFSCGKNELQSEMLPQTQNQD